MARRDGERPKTQGVRVFGTLTLEKAGGWLCVPAETARPLEGRSLIGSVGRKRVSRARLQAWAGARRPDPIAAPANAHGA